MCVGLQQLVIGLASEHVDVQQKLSQEDRQRHAAKVCCVVCIFLAFVVVRDFHHPTGTGIYQIPDIYVGTVRLIDSLVESTTPSE